MARILSLPWKPGIHIAFTGIDGSGKSTQAGKLTHHIQQKYGRAYLAEPRTDLTSQLLHILARQHGKTGRRQYFGDSLVDFSKAFDVVRDYYATVAPLLAAGMHIVEPRSIYCRIAMALGKSGSRDEKLDQVLAVIPPPDMLFWIDTDPKVALAGIQKRATDSEELDTLQQFSKAYRKMPETTNWIHIDGDETQGKIFNQIKKNADTLFA